MSTLHHVNFNLFIVNIQLIINNILLNMSIIICQQQLNHGHGNKINGFSDPRAYHIWLGPPFFI